MMNSLSLSKGSFANLGNSSLLDPPPKHVYISKGLGVKEYAYFEEMNPRFRGTMEDGHFIYDDILGDGKSILFGVVDGHGGFDVADYVIKNFKKEFLTQYTNCKKDIKTALEQSFLKVDEALKTAVPSEDVGSTACIGVVLYEIGKRVLYTANVGDTRAVLGQLGGCKRVSYDHKASDANEVARVKKDGGNIFFDRVEGSLAITRAFGDYAFKDKGVTAMPYIERTELRVIDKFLVVATDGLWDVIDDQEAIEIIKNRDGALDMAKRLVNTALEKYTRDNTSVLVLILN